MRFAEFAPWARLFPRRRRLLAAYSVLLLLALVLLHPPRLAGQAPVQSPAPAAAAGAPGKTASITAAASPTPRAHTFGRSRPADPRVFRFCNGAEPEVLDPGLMTAQADGRIGRAIFEGLVIEDPRTLDPIPGMAHRWDVSADGRTYTFHLRPDARWTNGDRVTAYDFEWAWTRVLHPDTPARNAGILYVIRNAAAYKKKQLADRNQVGIHALDEQTLAVELESPTPYFLQLLTYYPFLPVHRATVERNGDRWTRPENIVSNGPFRLVVHKPNDRIVLERDPQYWDAAHVKLDRVIVYAADDLSTMLNMYRAGMTDWNPSGYLPAQYIPYVRDNSDFRSGPYLGTYFYSFNVTRPPFDDARVRKALAYAVDRGALVKYLLYDSKTAWGGLVPPGFESYRYPQAAAFEPEKARALLAAAGYPGGKGFPKTEILFNTSQDHRKIAEAIQEMWKRELGIEVGLSNQEFASYMKATTSLQYQIARRSWIGDYKDPNTFLFLLRSGDGNNRTGWANARFDSLIEQAGREMDPRLRLQQLASAECIALDEMPFLPIYGYRTLELVAPYVRGWYPTALDSHPLKALWLDPSGGPAEPVPPAGAAGPGAAGEPGAAHAGDAP